MKRFLIPLLIFPAVIMASDYRRMMGPAGPAGEDGKGTALGIATGQHHFDYDTHQWQGSVGAGYFSGSDNSSALSVGVARRMCPSCGKALLNGSAGVTDDDDWGVGGGINFRW